MLKISIVDGRMYRRLVVEGMLVGPWAAELKSTCEKARADLSARELVLDMKHLTAISQEGENVLLGLLNDGIKFRCEGMFTKHVLKQLSRRVTMNHRQTKQVP